MFSQCLRNLRRVRVPRSRPSTSKAVPRRAPVVAVLLGASVAGLSYTASAKERHGEVAYNYKNTLLRRHFISYASVCYQDEPFMTGNDFIRAILDKEIDPSPGPTVILNDMQYEEIMVTARTVDVEAYSFLQECGDKYLISYAEYLFLLSIAVKPIDQFAKHFKILDRAKNNMLSKEEFQGVENVASAQLPKGTDVITSMQMLFFGPDQTGLVDFNTFSKFMYSVQKQCYYVEFEQYSDGLDYITDNEFVRLLLKRTSIPDIKKARYIDRFEVRTEAQKKRISFDQFCQFMNLLNDFPDFEVAIRMFAITKKPLTKTDFVRAVKASTGITFNKVLVDVVFDIFDEDNDNRLGQQEFIAVMKDQIKCRSSVQNSNREIEGMWPYYRTCIRTRMGKSYA